MTASRAGSGEVRASEDRDLATIVRDKTLQKVRAGKLSPTLQHGLMAQAMLDKRAERAADRQLAIRLAAMLAGGQPPAGIIRDVTPREADADDDEDEAFDPDDAALLGPGG